MIRALLFLFIAVQAGAGVVALGRLLPGLRRSPPPLPSDDAPPGAITVVVPVLNEAERLAPCLEGLMAQSDVVARILVVDSRSTDGTADIVRAAAQRDPRIELTVDEPAPPGWIGKVWALQHALPLVQTPWVLGVDADIVPQRGFAGGALNAAMRSGYDLVSFAPRFAGMTAAERFVQPAILATLVYRTGVPGEEGATDRVLANGQCFFAKREVLEDAGGYTAARTSWADDVTLARAIAARGARVGFLDGSRLYEVRAYASLGEMWREWGRSVDLTDANTRPRQWGDVALLCLAQALPLPMMLLLLVWRMTGGIAAALFPAAVVLFAINAVLFGARLGLLQGLSGSYSTRGAAFWCSPLADVPAVFRIVLSSIRRPRRWRGRRFDL